ncbi:MAG TPA: hypothetical protein VGV40_06965 [Solirubrobacteraceae bacterium]|nr:hypothetical protein [Solirubrobacteraceae bacterium]
MASGSIRTLGRHLEIPERTLRRAAAPKEHTLAEAADDVHALVGGWLREQLGSRAVAEGAGT